MTDEDLDALFDNPHIIRHKAKLYATRANAQAFSSSTGGIRYVRYVSLGMGERCNN